MAKRVCRCVTKKGKFTKCRPGAKKVCYTSRGLAGRRRSRRTRRSR